MNCKRPRMNKHTRRAREIYSQVQGKLRSQKFTAAWQASRQRSQKLMAVRQSARGSAVRNPRTAESEFYGCGRQWSQKFTGSGVRQLRLAKSGFYGVAGSGVSNLRIAESEICGCVEASGSEIYGCGVRKLRVRGRRRSQKFTESGIRNLRQWQAAESAIDR